DDGMVAAIDDGMGIVVEVVVVLRVQQLPERLELLDAPIRSAVRKRRRKFEHHVLVEQLQQGLALILLEPGVGESGRLDDGRADTRRGFSPSAWTSSRRETSVATVITCAS